MKTIQYDDEFTWIPASKPGDSPTTTSKFGGLPWLSADESWPACELCEQPMQLFVQINLSELEDKSGNHPFGDGLLQFFHCSLEACGDKGYEPFPAHQMKQVRIVYPDGVGKVCQLPPFATSVAIRHVTKWKRVVENDEPIQADKVGGEPVWIQSPEYPKCPECDQSMEFILQISDGPNLNWAWGDAGAAYIFRCDTHTEKLAMLWQCH